MPQKPLAPFISYLLFFYLARTFVWVYGMYRWANQVIGNATLIYALVNILFRLLIWVLPVLWYLSYVDKVKVFEYLQLKQYWKRGIVVGLMLFVINFGGTMVRVGAPDWGKTYITWNSVLGSSILVGFFEEIPFRGFILKKLQERLGFWASMFVSSMLFVLAHIPAWILLRSLAAYKIVYIFLFSAVMAIILKYSKSLWAPIVTHSLNDCLSTVIFHI